MDTDCASCINKSLEEALAFVAQGKKSKCLAACRLHWWDFTLFVFSMDGMMHEECKAAVKHSLVLLPEKWGQHHSAVCGHV